MNEADKRRLSQFITQAATLSFIGLMAWGFLHFAIRQLPLPRTTHMQPTPIDQCFQDELLWLRLDRNRDDLFNSIYQFNSFGYLELRFPHCAIEYGEYHPSMQAYK